MTGLLLLLALALPLCADEVPRVLLSCDASEKIDLKNAELLRDEPNAAFGYCAYKLTTAGKKDQVTLRRVLPAPLTLDHHVVTTWLRITDLETVGELTIDLKRGNDWERHYFQGNKIALRMIRRNDWSAVTFTPQGTVPVSEVQVSLRDTGHPATIWIGRVSAMPKTIDHGIVSITFDDGWSSVYHAARPIMDRYHYAGTAYITTGLVGTDKHMSLQQLLKLQDIHDWDIASHMVDHEDVSKLPQAQIIKQLRESKIWLLNHGFRTGAEHVAFPFGGFDAEEVQTQVRYLYRSARLIDGPMETLPVGDPWRLRVLLVINTTTVADVAAKIDEAMRNRDWLILVFHRIEPANVKVQFDTQYSEPQFSQIIDMLYQKKVAVEPVSRVIHELGFDY